MKKLLLSLLSIILISTPAYARKDYPTIEYDTHLSKSLVKYESTLISSDNKVMVKTMLKALKIVYNNGYKLPKLIVADKTEYLMATQIDIIDKPRHFIMGNTHIEDNIVYINPYEYKYSQKEAINTILHEIGHVNHIDKLVSAEHSSFMYRKLRDNSKEEDYEFKMLKPQIEIVLGSYAVTSEFEFVACFFAAMLEGRDLPDYLWKLYSKLGGPLNADN